MPESCRLILLPVLALLAAGTAACPLGESDPVERGTVVFVNDGDTLELADGRRVRLLGINAPEIDHEAPHDSEPLALEARAALRTLFPEGTSVLLRLDEEQRDRYGRLLAHLYTMDRLSVAETLLERGLAVTLVMPPNRWQADCYLQAEGRARRGKAGLWRDAAAVSAASVNANGRFQRVRGVVTRQYSTDRYHHLLLDERVLLRVRLQDWPDVSGEPPKTFSGRQLVARGWVQNERGKPVLRIRHRSAVETLH